MKKLIVMMMGAMAFASCGTGQKAAPLTLLEGEWVIVEVAEKPVSAENVPFLGFKVADKELYGNAGCNSLMGVLEGDEAQPGVLSFGTLGSTKRMCADMAAEDAILQALGQVKGYELKDGHLLLTDEAGKELMELTKR